MELFNLLLDKLSDTSPERDFLMGKRARLSGVVAAARRACVNMWLVISPRKAPRPLRSRSALIFSAQPWSD